MVRSGLVTGILFAGGFVMSAAAPTLSVTGAEVGDTSQVVVLQHASQIFHNQRAIRIYLPPGYDDSANADRRYPVLYLNDGFAVFSPRSWNLRHVLDSLIASHAVDAPIVVGIDNAASIPGVVNPDHDRTNEFLPYPDSTEPDVPHPRGLEYADFIVREVMPLIGRTVRVDTSAAKTSVGGASYGGLAALVTVLRYPGRFGGLLLESTPLFLFGERLLTESRSLQTWPGAVYVGLGTHELGDDKPIVIGDGPLERFVELANRQAPGTRVLFKVTDGAHHDAKAWRDRLPISLGFLFR